jgi:hypothetical protein
MATARASATARRQTPSFLYRYRTKALVGPWRPTRLQAIEDAVKARQAVRDTASGPDVNWRVEGEIERS